MLNAPSTSISFWVCAVLAVMVVGLAKAGFTGGIGVLAAPFLAMVMPIADAVALLMPLIIVTDVFTVYQYRNSYDLGILKRFAPYAILGVCVGTLFFNFFRYHETILRVSIGGLVIIFVGIRIIQRLRTGTLKKRTPGQVQTVVLGLLTGFAAMIAHAGGPIGNMYLLPQKLPRRLHMGTAAVLFFALNIVKLIPYTVLGLLAAVDLTTLLILTPVTFISVKVGVFLNSRVSDVWFARVVYALLLFTGFQLLTGFNLTKLLAG